jgi:hypothetical protein
MVVKIIGFIVGFAVVSGLEVTTLSPLHGMPRGLGWVVLPIMAGVGLARVAPDLVERFFNSGSALWQMSPGVRLVGVMSAVWLVAVPAYWWLFEPYDGWMSSDEYALMYKVMFFPISVLVAGYIAYVKFVVGSPRSSDES